jgi:hypothetical protein
MNKQKRKVNFNNSTPWRCSVLHTSLKKGTLPLFPTKNFEIQDGHMTTQLKEKKF